MCLSICILYYQIIAHKGTLSTKCHKDYAMSINYNQLLPMAPISLLFVFDLLVSFYPDKEVRWEVDRILLRKAMRRRYVSQIPIATLWTRED